MQGLTKWSCQDWRHSRVQQGQSWSGGGGGGVQVAGGAYLDWSQARPGRGERDQQVDRDLPRKAADAGGLGGGAGLHWEHPPGDGRGQQDRRESSVQQRQCLCVLGEDGSGRPELRDEGERQGGAGGVILNEIKYRDSLVWVGPPPKMMRTVMASLVSDILMLTYILVCCLYF